MLKSLATLTLSLALLGLAACAPTPEDPMDDAGEAAPPAAAVATSDPASSTVEANRMDRDAAPARAAINNADGEQIGTAELQQTAHGVLVEVTLTNAPEGEHAFHIHESGACEAPDFTSAGGHFNPASRKHGFLAAEGIHAGDLPNIVVPASGALKFELVAAAATLGTSDHSLFDADGSALVMHEGPDDYQTDPAGAAGSRIACGSITR